MAKRLLLVVLLLGFGAWLLTGLTEVNPGEHAVVRRWGKVVAVQSEPGLLVGLPWGIDRVDRVAVEQVRRVVVGFRPEEETTRSDTPGGQLLTGDHNLVNVQLVVKYRVQADKVVEFVVAQPVVEDILTRTLEDALSEWTASKPVDEVLLHGKDAIRDALGRTVPTRLAPYQLGIDLNSIEVTHLLPPNEVKPAFDRVAQAQTEIRTAKNQAEQQALRAQSNFEIEKQRMENETRAYVFKLPRFARADATVFLGRLGEKQRNPAVVQVNRLEYLVNLVDLLSKKGQMFPLDGSLGQGTLESSGKSSTLP